MICRLYGHYKSRKLKAKSIKPIKALRVALYALSVKIEKTQRKRCDLMFSAVKIFGLHALNSFYDKLARMIAPAKDSTRFACLIYFTRLA